MLYNFVQKPFAQLLSRCVFKYGELTFTTSLQAQFEFPRVPTFRLLDLDGNLLDNKAKYDTQLLTKILKTMVFVDEMDSILLKVKGQGSQDLI
jgi:hypothetical protein